MQPTGSRDPGRTSIQRLRKYPRLEKDLAHGIRTTVTMAPWLHSRPIVSSARNTARAATSSLVAQPHCVSFFATACGSNDNKATTLKRQQQQRPNQFTSIYNQMQIQCPLELRDYANCVINIHNHPDEILEKGSCEDEFRAVKECFRSVRSSLRQQQTPR
jgi:hypothetical protein